MTNVKIGSVISADGTAIGYRTLGGGRAVVLLHGAMESSASHLQLAQALAADFTLYLPDRRGRGLSGPHRRDHSIRTEVEDLLALLTATGARDVFGVSSGGVVALQTALTTSALDRVAVFEPPLIVDGSLSTAWLERYDREMARGKVAAALVTGMLGTRMGPPLFDRLPRWLLKLLTIMLMASEDRKARAGGDEVPFGALAPTLHYEARLAIETTDMVDDFKAVDIEALLLGGGRSPAYLKTALDALEKALPHARRVEFPGLGHGASGNTGKGGHPEQVARELRHFLTRP
ncbi:alpha/beta hydrolase [Streptosporangium sp. NPDC051023]|uniref:alpha/beta fold hydrolase n=1 Tax=Streptosporangium sp. NPDC051023 TaxID=3155410 RepID=UPI00344E7406